MSASSSTEICNRALTLIGSNTIPSLLDESKESKVCNIHYAGMRDEVTAAIEWSHARRRFGPMTPEATPPAFGFSTSYLLPTDLLKLTYVADGQAENHELRHYVVENNRLLCDRGENVYIRYIARVEDTTKFVQLYTEALVQRLAAQISIPLTESLNTYQTYMQVYQQMLENASAVDNQQGRTPPTTVTRHRRARWSSGAYGAGFFRAGL